MTPRAVRLFYDGRCGLCHAAVRFVARRDREGRIRFAPLGGEAFDRLVPGGVRQGLPDSLAVQLEDGRLLTQSAAVVCLLLELGGGWRWLGAWLGRLPSGFLDRAYVWVACHRRSLSRVSDGPCPRLPPALGDRFDP